MAEVAKRIEYLRLLPIETVQEKRSAAGKGGFGLFNQPGPAEVTVFTRDLALLLKASARLDDALELLASDADVGRLRPVVGKLRNSLLSGESLAEALSAYPDLFPPMYIALVKVGEISGTLDQVLEMLGEERARSEQMRRKLTDAMQYPAFVLMAAMGVMLFFILFVLPQFSSMMQDLGAKSDTALIYFLRLSDFLRANGTLLSITAIALVTSAWMGLRRREARAVLAGAAARLPGLSSVFHFYRTSLFCRNLGVLLGSGVSLTATLRILVDIMAVTGRLDAWTLAADRVRHGGKLSEALSASASLPPMALRMLRLGEETGQLPALAGRVAEFYEAKLQRSLDRIVAVVGPVAIITISTVVGGLIVSVMTALLSVTQLIG
nr:type II secretion system F family protein [Bradyrhizobium sp. KB893862 SZCCT0404]